MSKAADDDLRQLRREIDRIQSHLAIQQLVSRYARAMDSRNLDEMTSLFVPDVRVGKSASGADGGGGRDTLRKWFEGAMTMSYRSIHLIAGHVIEFDDDDHAHGTTHCYAEEEIGGDWLVTLYYSQDKYERHDGEWLFVRRRGQPLYRRDIQARPDVNPPSAPGTPDVRLPKEFPTFVEFWKTIPADVIGRLTQHPIA